MMFYALDMVGTAAFAITGILLASRKNMDLFGAFVMAFVTAIGGGTLRDLLLGNGPVFWISDTNYLLVTFAASLLGVIAQQWWRKSLNLLLSLDAIGLAIFSLIGVQKGLMLDVHYGVIILMAVVNGVGGSVLRDLLAGTIPLVFRGEIYAVAAMVGAIVYIGMDFVGLSSALCTITAASTIFCLRIYSMRKNLSLPRSFLSGQ